MCALHVGQLDDLPEPTIEEPGEGLPIAVDLTGRRPSEVVVVGEEAVVIAQA
jgi:hypothetical protein